MIRKATIVLVLCLSTQAHSGVIYSVTFDTLLNNDGFGVFGGDLSVGQGQPLNLTLEYTYSDRPNRTEPGNAIIDGRSIFDLLGIRVFDNTNGRSSDVFARGGGWLELSYRGDLDWFSGAGRQGAASGLLMPTLSSRLSGLPFDLGDVGDALPYGESFDRLVEDGQVSLIATAGANQRLEPGSFIYNYVNQLVGGIDPLPQGEFSFESRFVPVPSTALLLIAGFLGMVSVLKRAGPT